jgi:hypothetical protein
MERAPARLAPSIKEWLRGLDAGWFTEKSPRAVGLAWQKNTAITRVLGNGEAKANLSRGTIQNEAIRTMSQINTNATSDKSSLFIYARVADKSIFSEVLRISHS